MRKHLPHHNTKFMALSEKKNKKDEVNGPLRAPKGMHDVLPVDAPYWEKVDRTLQELVEFYGFHYIETPVLENIKLFERGVGDETDLVQKEMFLVPTKTSGTLALRPEGTAPVARAYLEHNLGRGHQPQKLYYKGPIFRHENPQLGRYRQFHQAGFEILGGPNDPLYDAQVILIFYRLLTALKIKQIKLLVNSIGCRVCRPLYKKQLQNYYKRHEKELCEDCERRLKTNPLRLLDCKKEQCQKFKENAPSFFDKLCVACSRHLRGVLEYLDELKIPYMLSNELVRGFDYYSRTVFEFFAEGEGSELGALAGGGRYDYLIEMVGGRLTPAVGGAVGIERVIALMKLLGIVPPPRPQKRVFLAHAGELAKKKCVALIEELRAAGILVSEALTKESLKAQLKLADKEGVALALILGQKEIYEESVIIRDLKTGSQEAVSWDKMAAEIKKRSREAGV
jgi:histidyl-tRNA synthetase